MTSRKRSRAVQDDQAPRRSPAPAEASSIGRLRTPLLRWYREHRRDLPWRRTRDPYAIWVSEIMLQQTRVATVLPYYARFLARFPDPGGLARASEEEVLAVWSGLGYYRRARALRDAAHIVMERHGGSVPRDPRDLRRLPGIGAYTAGAIASIAYGLPEPVLDGNVRRVLSRLLAVEGTDAAADRALWDAARTLVRGPTPGDLNQALMELGALVCTARDPACAACPVSRHCRARTAGNVEAYPGRRPARAAERVRVAVAVVERDGRVLLERPGDDSPLRGSWDLPALELPPGGAPRPRIREVLRRRHGLTLEVGERSATHAHGILHRRLRLEVHPCRMRRGRVAGRPNVRWIRSVALDDTPVSGATRKVLRARSG